MTTLENRPNSALLVVDVQNDVVDGAYERDSVVANIGNLVERARDGGPDVLRGAVTSRRDRPHQALLGSPDGTGADGQSRHDRGRPLRLRSAAR
jgi:nicotinamidase-related amidase